MAQNPDGSYDMEIRLVTVESVSGGAVAAYHGLGRIPDGVLLVMRPGYATDAQVLHWDEEKVVVQSSDPTGTPIRLLVF